MEVAGVDKNDLKVRFSRTQISITGTRKLPFVEGVVVKNEIESGHFEQTFNPDSKFDTKPKSVTVAKGLLVVVCGLWNDSTDDATLWKTYREDRDGASTLTSNFHWSKKAYCSEFKTQLLSYSVETINEIPIDTLTSNSSFNEYLAKCWYSFAIKFPQGRSILPDIQYMPISNSEKGAMLLFCLFHSTEPVTVAQFIANIPNEYSL